MMKKTLLLAEGIKNTHPFFYVKKVDREEIGDTCFYPAKMFQVPSDIRRVDACC